MTDYSPPTETLPIFDSSVFSAQDSTITQADADKRYLRYPTAQGTENFTDLTVSGTETVKSTSGTTDISMSVKDFRIQNKSTSGTITLQTADSGGILQSNLIMNSGEIDAYTSMVLKSSSKLNLNNTDNTKLSTVWQDTNDLRIQDYTSSGFIKLEPSGLSGGPSTTFSTSYLGTNVYNDLYLYNGKKILFNDTSGVYQSNIIQTTNVFQLTNDFTSTGSTPGNISLRVRNTSGTILDIIQTNYLGTYIGNTLILNTSSPSIRWGASGSSPYQDSPYMGFLPSSQTTYNNPIMTLNSSGKVIYMSSSIATYYGNFGTGSTLNIGSITINYGAMSQPDFLKFRISCSIEWGTYSSQQLYPNLHALQGELYIFPTRIYKGYGSTIVANYITSANLDNTLGASIQNSSANTVSQTYSYVNNSQLLTYPFNDGFTYYPSQYGRATYMTNPIITSAGATPTFPIATGATTQKASGATCFYCYGSGSGMLSFMAVNPNGYGSGIDGGKLSMTLELVDTSASTAGYNYTISTTGFKDNINITYAR